MSSLTEWSLISAGENDYGQLGRGGDGRIPKLVENFPKKNISCISAGYEHSVALYKDGSVFGWGLNGKGRLGFPEEVEEVEFPTKINGLPKIIDVKCGFRFTLFLTEEKKVLIASICNKKSLFEEITICEPVVALFGICDPWIVGESGTIYWYDFRETNRIEKFGPFPFGIPKQIVSIEYSVLLLTTSGETYGMSVKKLRPHIFDEDTKVVCENEDNFSLIESLRDVKIIKISGFDDHFLALSEDNKVFAWGKNDYGQLGVGDEKDRYDCFVLSTVSGDAKIVDIAAGGSHSIFVDSTGHVWGFGIGEDGETMLGEYEEEGPLSKVIESAVSTYCGGYFSFVFIGNSSHRLPEAGTLFSMSKENKQTLNKHLEEENERFKEMIKQTEQEKRTFEKKYQELNEIISHKETENEQLRHENEKLHHENEKLHQENEILKRTICEYQSKMIENASNNHQESFNESLQIFSQSEIDHFTYLQQIGQGGSSKVLQVSRSHIYALKILELNIRDNSNSNSNFNANSNSNVCAHAHVRSHAHEHSHAHAHSHDNDHDTSEEEEYDDESDSDSDLDEKEEEEAKGEENYDYDKVRRFLKEYEIMSQISHPNILKTYGICYGDEKHPPSILLEYCPTNLKDSIQTLTKEEQSQIILEICNGMKYLHSQGLIHRDLKPENILLDSSKHVKICDFGISTLSTETTHTNNIGTFAYMSPEQLNCETHYTNKVDIYSFGLLLIFILTRGKTFQVPLVNVIQGKKIRLPTQIKFFYKTIIRTCLSFNPDDRPTFEELIETISHKSSH